MSTLDRSLGEPQIGLEIPTVELRVPCRPDVDVALNYGDGRSRCATIDVFSPTKRDEAVSKSESGG